jgi:hypothetical protein
MSMLILMSMLSMLSDPLHLRTSVNRELTHPYSFFERMQSFSTSRPSQDLAKLTLVGRLVAAPKVMDTSNGKPICFYRIAVNSYRPNAETPGNCNSLHRRLMSDGQVQVSGTDAVLT